VSVRHHCGCAVLMLCCASVTAAQRAPVRDGPMRWRPSVRADATLDRDPGAQLTIGVATPTAYNTRLGVDVSAGGVDRPSGWTPAGRVEVLARWLTDPFRQSRWALHAGGGVAIRLEDMRSPAYVAVIAVGVDGPRDGRWVPGVEVAMGGGVRAGVTLRRAPANRR
jgi:hypothetical protein